jgi:ubiquinone/menaquinone biosynthesis C-methylase UbiE
MSDGVKMTESSVAESTQQMMKILGGMWVAKCVSAAAELGVADVIGDGRKTTEEIAAATKTHAASLYRLLRALAGANVFREESKGVWTNTALSKVLRTGVPGSLRYCAIAALGQEHYGAWGALTDCVRTGEAGVKHVYGMEIWDYYRANERHAKNFDQFMIDFSEGINDAFLKAYDFGGIKHLVDVGGGHGGVIAAILQKYPKLHGTLFDQPQVVAGAKRNLDLHGVASRCERVAGNFFESVPAGADAYFMKFILHDWDDAKSLTILNCIRRAIDAKGKLIVADTVIPEGNSEDFSKLMDVNMLVMTGGIERTQKQFTELFAQAGFKLTRIVPTEAPLSLIEGIPV